MRAVLLDGTGGVSAFLDLGTGVAYGSFMATEADSNIFITIDLNASAVADANAAAGELWALGGAITTLDGDIFTNEGLFGGSADSPSTQLVLTLIPAPGAVALFGLAGLMGTRRRRR